MGIGEQNGKFEGWGERTNAILGNTITLENKFSFFWNKIIFIWGGGGDKGTGTPHPGRASYRKLLEKHK